MVTSPTKSGITKHLMGTSGIFIHGNILGYLYTVCISEITVTRTDNGNII